MKMKQNIWLQVVFLLILGTALLILSGCPMDPAADSPAGEDPAEEETSEEEEETTVIPPPENLLGTIALDNGKSAVMDLQFASASSNYLPGLTPRATLSVAGNVRYEGRDYIVGGLYNDETAALDIIAENSATGERFLFSGTYTPGSGFSGTVTLYDSGDQVIAEGSISSAEATDDERDTIRIFTGTFGGGAWGTWNGTITADRFYGTWSGITGIDEVTGEYEWDSGTVSLDRSGTALENLSGTGGPGNGGGTIDDSVSGSWTVSGWWATDDYENSGSWSGYQVDENYDQHVPTATDDPSLLSNIILQAFENGISNYFNRVRDDDYDTSSLPPDGDGYIIGPDDLPGSAGIQATINMIWDAGEHYEDDMIIDFNSYTDGQTGLILDGALYQLMTEDPVTEEMLSQDLVLDSNVGTINACPDASMEGGFKITFADATFLYLYIDAVVDYENEEIITFQQTGPVWTISTDETYDPGDTDVVSDIELIMF